MNPAVEGTTEGLETFWHERPAKGSAPVLYVHGVPTHADDWLPFLERTGGIALDLPGFGRSAKPPRFDYSIEGYRRFLRAFVDERGLDRFSLVVHDWGAVGLALAQEMPERIERVVVIDAVPLLPGYRWHRVARVWRTPLLGELFMGLSSKWGFKQISRAANPNDGPMSPELIDRVWRHWDQGTMRAILKLYRSAPPDVLAAAGERLGDIGSPSLVVWGAHEPYIPAHFAHAYGKALDAEVEVVDGAGHWPWLDRPAVIERVTRFLLG